MAPKGKKGKKGNDDWDADMGETVDPVAQAEQVAKAEEAAKDADADDNSGGGGLMAALKKNRDKKKKKGKVVEDFVEGEDPPDMNGDEGTASPAPAAVDLDAKAPEEANLEEEDVFAQPVKKSKGGKQAPAKKAAPPAEEEDEDGEDGEETGGKVKTKAQKEKEKKEREKQRKKEQVCISLEADTSVS